MRLPAVTVLLLTLLAGCAGDPAAEPEPETPELRMVALDGRWSFPPATAEAQLQRAGAPAPSGALVMGEARGARAVGDFVGLDGAAAAKLGVERPAPGEAVLARAFAEREGAAAGGTLALASHAWPAPYVATYFEMERTPPCERRPDAKLCFQREEEPGTARLRLRVDEGGRDAAFLPDLVELGPGGRPAWWNGSFASPSGETFPFVAHAPLAGDLVPAERPGPMEAGEWTISFRLEANGKLAPSGAAGIVRVREPGYLWFDDRLQQSEDAAAQARAVLSNATPTRLEVRVARIAETLPGGADILLVDSDARTLTGAEGVTALLVDMTPSQEHALGALRASDGISSALRPRPLPGAEARPPARGALVLAAPPDLDLASLPPVEGALVPSLALAGRASVGEPLELDAVDSPRDTLLLAHAAGEVPWALPPGSRWTRTDDALENLSRSRTLALASADILAAPIATMRVEMGEGNTSRSMVAIGAVAGGPERTLWTSAALVAGAGHPVTPRLIVPLVEGADRAVVAERLLASWAPYGIALDR